MAILLYWSLSRCGGTGAFQIYPDGQSTFVYSVVEIVGILKLKKAANISLCCLVFMTRHGKHSFASATLS